MDGGGGQETLAPPPSRAPRPPLGSAIWLRMASPAFANATRSRAMCRSPVCAMCFRPGREGVKEGGRDGERKAAEEVFLVVKQAFLSGSDQQGRDQEAGHESDIRCSGDLAMN